jgi:hypothetical protein
MLNVNTDFDQGFDNAYMEDVPVDKSKLLAASFKQSFSEGLTSTMSDLLDNQQNNPTAPKFTNVFGTVADALDAHKNNPLLSPQDANERAQGTGLTFNQPIYKNQLNDLMKEKNEEIERERVLSRANATRYGASISTVGSLLGSVADPLQDAAYALPIGGEVEGSAMAARIGERYTALIKGAGQGAAAQTLIEPFEYMHQNMVQDDYNKYQFLSDIATASFIGGAGHAIGHGISMKLRRSAFQTAVKQAMENKEIKVDPIFSSDPNTFRASRNESYESPEGYSAYDLFPKSQTTEDVIGNTGTSKSLDQMAEEISDHGNEYPNKITDEEFQNESVKSAAARKEYDHLGEAPTSDNSMQFETKEQLDSFFKKSPFKGEDLKNVLKQNGIKYLHVKDDNVLLHTGLKTMNDLSSFQGDQIANQANAMAEHMRDPATSIDTSPDGSQYARQVVDTDDDLDYSLQNSLDNVERNKDTLSKTSEGINDDVENSIDVDDQPHIDFLTEYSKCMRG